MPSLNQSFLFWSTNPYCVSYAPVKNLVIEKCEGPTPTTWDEIINVEVEETDNHLQSERFPLKNAGGLCDFFLCLGSARRDLLMPLSFIDVSTHLSLNLFQFSWSSRLSVYPFFLVFFLCDLLSSLSLMCKTRLIYAFTYAKYPSISKSISILPIFVSLSVCLTLTRNLFSFFWFARSGGFPQIQNYVRLERPRNSAPSHCGRPKSQRLSERTRGNVVWW